MNAAPPRPPFALNIGVIGHRPDAARFPRPASQNVEAEVCHVLSLVYAEAQRAMSSHGDLFAGTTPLLTIVSALADGADQIVARAGLTNGFQLDAPIPFERAVYKGDFTTQQSQEEFDRLLGRARSVLELSGVRGADESAYEAAGLTVLAQADLLIAIWDGEMRGGRGGTADLLPFAARAGLPIIHIHAKGQEATRLLWRGNEEALVFGERLEDLRECPFLESLPSVLDQLTAPPSEADEKAALDHFLICRQPILTGVAFPTLLAVARLRRLRWHDIKSASPDNLAADFARLEAASIGAPAGPGALFAQSYGWADGLAVSFSQKFRSAFVANFALSATAVIAAVCPLLKDDPVHLADMVQEKMPFVVVELALISCLLLNTFVGKGRRWHGRWVETRELAERFRAALPLWAVGLRPAVFVSAEPTWTGWYGRAILRGVGLRPGKLNEAGLDRARQSLLALLNDQRDYNKATHTRMHDLNRRLERLGFTLLGATAGLAVLFILAVLAGVAVPLRYAFVLTALAAGLPAIATASYGIRVIGDFEGIAGRAKRTEELLQLILEKVERDKLPTLSNLRACTRATADALLGNVSSWRLAAESRKLNMPG